MSYHAVDHDHEKGGFGDRLPSFKLIGGLAVIVAVVIFFFQNGHQAAVEFLWIDVDWAVRNVIVISLVAGALLDRIFVWQWRRARQRKAHRDALG